MTRGQRRPEPGARLNPTGLKREYLRQCLDVLSADPAMLRWRARPRSHFLPGGKGDLAFRTWASTFAGETIRPQGDGRLRLSITGPDGERHKIDARAIIAEIGITPPAKRFGPTGPTQADGPNDRFAEHRELAGSGPLAAVMRDAMDETGSTLTELTVMDPDKDPYRIDTPAKHRDAQWFAALVERFLAPGQRIHPRGIFYACVGASPPVIKPNGDPFVNTAEDAKFLGEAASYARWLGHIDFERLVDAKNDEPVVLPAPSSDDPMAYVSADDLAIEDLDSNAIGVSAALANFEPRQPYRLVFFGEKTSLEDGLKPLAEEVGADLYLMSGQISNAHLHSIAKDADADGRPLVMLTFSDCDPAGYWDMPVAIGRKLQALRDLKFPELRFTVVHAALGPEQVRDLDLPSSPFKEGEKRGALWEELYGTRQTEIDALATLRPEVLERIAREAVAPYFDAGLRRRVTSAEGTWYRRVQTEIAGQRDENRIDVLKERAESALDELREVNAEITAIADEIDVSEAPELPEPDMAALEEAQAVRRSSVLIDSDMSFAEATERLQAHGERAARRRP